MSQEEREQSARIKQAKVDQLAGLTDDELLAEVIKDKPYIQPEESASEIQVRQIRVVKALTLALNDFKRETKTASNRLESLTRWLIAFTIALVLLGLVVAVHDLTR